MKVKHVIIAASAVIIALVAAFYFVLHNERAQLQEEKDLFASEQKEIMQEELQKLASEYDIQYQKLSQGMGEQKISLATDSLISQLLSERAKVEQLQKELKSNKATSAKRIGQLTQEISTLRNVLKNYVIQIDSLQSANDRLRQENSEVRASYARATNEAQQLSNEKAQLSDRVKLAAKLDATRISITPMDKRGKLSKKLEKTVNIQIHFTVAKNVTAAVGEKTFYCPHHTAQRGASRQAWGWHLPLRRQADPLFDSSRDRVQRRRHPRHDVLARRREPAEWHLPRQALR